MQLSVDVLDNSITPLKASVKSRFAAYDEDSYKKDVLKFGIEKTWQDICEYLLKNDETVTGFLETSKLSEIYEIGLEITGKEQKKEAGKYFTPNDVSLLMSAWFDRKDAECICDVACGTGNLILAYLDYIGESRAKKILNDGKLYLYEIDSTALLICKTLILMKYGIKYADKINAICGDFLNIDVVLPHNCKVISNPPYSEIQDLPAEWEQTDVLTQSKEQYSAFMEKILVQSAFSVVITPYSFLGGSKFFALRTLMNDYNGFIVPFDNVPGSIFCGKKHGVFNSNTSNSVRAAITVTENVENVNGYRVCQLIRFKNEERGALLHTDVLENLLPDEYQCIDEDNRMYVKCNKELLNIYRGWVDFSQETLGNYVKKDGEYKLYIPKTCRYFTVASINKLNRSGQMELCFENSRLRDFAFCLINSSFAYWFWRLFDGGITYPKGLLLKLPMFFENLSEEDRMFFIETAEEMSDIANEFLVIKNNKGDQENIKYPRFYRDKINKKLLEVLHIEADERVFDVVHSNMALEVSV